MKIIEMRHFPGINVHCYKPALEAVLDMGDFYGRESHEFPEACGRLLELLPGLKEHTCGLGKRGGFVIRLQKGTYLGHVTEHVAIEMLSCLGLKSSYGKTRQMSRERCFRVVFQCDWPQTAMAAMEQACHLVLSLFSGDSSAAWEPVYLERSLEGEKPGPSTQAIIDAARHRGIPVRQLGSGSLLRMGTGCYRQYIQATITGQTSCIGVDIACDKTLTKKVLGEAFIPTPQGSVAGNEEEAVRIARELGGKVVVKPCDGNQGKGVSLNLESENEVRAAYKLAENYNPKVIVEQQIFGRHYRILVVAGVTQAVSERFPARVTGDGIHTVRELIDLENRNPLRGEEHEKPLTKIRVDQVMFNVLARQNMTINFIPAPGQVIVLRDNANLSTGGTAEDRTEQIHPDNAALACRIARLLGMDVAGIDVVTEDISRPLLATGGAIIEVNAAPGIRMHLYPSKGKSRPVAEAIVDYLFPWEKPHSVPIISITGTNGKTTTSRMIAHALRANHLRAGLASTDGIYLDGQYIDGGDNTGPGSAEVVLSDPLVEVAVLETARGGLVRRGLGYQESKVAVVTNIASDHLGTDDIDTLEEMAHVKALVPETVAKDGSAVLNADDSRVRAMARRTPGQVIFFSLEGKRNREYVRHVAAGGRGVSVHKNEIILVEGGRTTTVANLKDVAITFNGHARYNVANTLAATGALWAMGLSPEQIARGIKSFDSREHNPGRANLYDLQTCRVLVDYGHNLAGISNIVALARALEPKRLVGVVGVPGDRQDQDILAVGELCGREFDLLYIKEDKDLRGRSQGQVADLLLKGVRSGNPQAAAEIIHCELKALQQAVDSHAQDDLILIFYEKLEPLRDYLSNITPQSFRGKKKDFVPAR